MKNLALFIITVAYGLSGVACRKNDGSLEGRTGLPKATQTGMNTFGALVNDELVESKKRLFGYGTPLEARYEYLTGSNRQVFVIRATDHVSPNLKGITIAIDTTITEGMVYNFYKKQDTLQTLYFIYNKKNYTSNDYTIDPPLKGQLNITKFDDKAHILSGTFYFDAINKDGEKVSVTNGRFDVTYYQNVIVSK